MEHFKIENFRKEHPGEGFPTFRSLSQREAAAVRERLATAANVGPVTDLLAFTQAVCGQTGAVGASASEASFDLCSTLSGLGINSESKLFLNWYRFDTIDEIELEALGRYFHDIWYPGADDIDIFDGTYEWMISIRHDGRISCAYFTSS